MGTLTPAQMFDHTLNVIKGPSLMHRLDFRAAPAASEAIAAGSVCSINAAGQLIAGCTVGAAMNRPMPMFSIQNVDDFDANSDVGNISGGVMSAIVATGGFEIETTEYDTAGTYNPNDFLTADGVNTGDVKRMVEAPYGGQVGVGVVSEGTSTNADGKSVIRFWTVYLPGGAGGYDNSSSSSSDILNYSSSSSSSSSTLAKSTSSSSSSSSSTDVLDYSTSSVNSSSSTSEVLDYSTSSDNSASTVGKSTSSTSVP